MNNNESSGNQISNHILPSAANLLGVCFLIFSIVHSLGNQEKSLIDEFALSGVFVFLGASIFSYLSLRAKRRNILLERIADAIFIFGLFLLTIASVLIVYILPG